jgi:hypothetical protein
MAAIVGAFGGGGSNTTSAAESLPSLTPADPPLAVVCISTAVSGFAVVATSVADVDASSPLDASSPVPAVPVVTAAAVVVVSVTVLLPTMVLLPTSVGTAIATVPLPLAARLLEEAFRLPIAAILPLLELPLVLWLLDVVCEEWDLEGCMFK